MIKYMISELGSTYPVVDNDKTNKNFLPGQGAASPLWGLGQSPNYFVVYYKTVKNVPCLASSAPSGR